MGFNRRHLQQLVAVGLVLVHHADAQAECPTESALEIQNITSTAEIVWTERWAERRTAWSAGRDAATAAVPGRVQGLNVSVAPEFSLEGSADLHEYVGAATIAIELGNLSSTRVAAISADYDVVDARLAVERWQFVDGVQDAYLAWRINELERGHLANYLSEANAELDPIRTARDRQLISRLDLADLEAEVGWIRAELAEATRRAKLSRSRLEALLGTRCELGAVPAVHDEPAQNNPWTALVKRTDDFPEVRAFAARQQALEARARMHDAANPWVLEIGLGARSVGFSTSFLGPVLTLTLPFQATEAADAEISRAEARSEASAGAWAALQIRAELEAEAANFDALVAGYFELKTGYVVPLDERAELMTEAFKASQVEIDRLIRARRELHEAEHKLILHRAEIDARRLKATAIKRLLESSEQAGGRP